MFIIFIILCCEPKKSANNYIFFFFLVINTVVEPSGQSEETKASASAVSSSSGVRPSRTPSSRDWRTIHSASKRGGGQRPGESVRRAAVTPDDLREGYLVWGLRQTHRFYQSWTSATNAAAGPLCRKWNWGGGEVKRLLHIQTHCCTMSTTHLHCTQRCNTKANLHLKPLKYTHCEALI